MVSKIATFRLPENLIQEIRSRAEATGRDRTAVVVGALKHAFGFPPSESRPSKIATFRLPENLIQEIRSRAEATGRDRTAVVVGALKHAFGFPPSESRPSTVEELQEQLNKLEKKFISLSERLIKLTQKPLSESRISQISPALRQAMSGSNESEQAASFAFAN